MKQSHHVPYIVIVALVAIVAVVVLVLNLQSVGEATLIGPKSSYTPVVTPTQGSIFKKNGASCTKNDECASGLCGIDESGRVLCVTPGIDPQGSRCLFAGGSGTTIAGGNPHRECISGLVCAALVNIPTTSPGGYNRFCITPKNSGQTCVEGQACASQFCNNIQGTGSSTYGHCA